MKLLPALSRGDRVEVVLKGQGESCWPGTYDSYISPEFGVIDDDQTSEYRNAEVMIINTVIEGQVGEMWIDADNIAAVMFYKDIDE